MSQSFDERVQALRKSRMPEQVKAQEIEDRSEQIEPFRPAQAAVVAMMTRLASQPAFVRVFGDIEPASLTFKDHFEDGRYRSQIQFTAQNAVSLMGVRDDIGAELRCRFSTHERGGEPLFGFSLRQGMGLLEKVVAEEYPVDDFEHLLVQAEEGLVTYVADVLDLADPLSSPGMGA